MYSPHVRSCFARLMVLNALSVCALFRTKTIKKKENLAPGLNEQSISRTQDDGMSDFF